MKTTTLLTCAVTFAMILSCSSAEKDSVKQAQKLNENSAIDENISKFLTNATDARMMDIEQGKLAKVHGTTAEIRQYGEKMITDQTKLLHEIRVLAASKNITVPTTLSNEKADGLKDLQEEKGEDFDMKFVKMMVIDHKRDVREFEKATDFKDQDVKKFAGTYLPMIESHLEHIRAIKENTKAEISERSEKEAENE